MGPVPIMGLYPAPLRNKKMASLSVSADHARDRPRRSSLSAFGRNTPTQPITERSSSDATVIASIRPSLHSEQRNLEVPKVRRSNTKFAEQSSEKGSQRRISTRQGSNAAYMPVNDVIRVPSARSAIKSGRDSQNQRIDVKSDSQSQSQGKISQFFQTLDKRFSRQSIRDVSKRFSSNIRTPQVEHRSNSSMSCLPLEYNLAPPISVLNMEVYVVDSLSDFRPSEAYIHINITADVNMESAKHIPYSLNIAAMILLNMTSETEIMKVTSLAQVVIDELKENDFLVVACVNYERQDCIDVLYSGTEIDKLNLRRLLSDCTSVGKQIIKGAFRDDDLVGDAVSKASQMFEINNHSTPHIFLISANHDTTLNTAYNATVRLTTVTLEDHCDLGPAPRSGWHIYPETDFDDSPTTGLKSKVEKALHHIRSGFTPGNLTNLHVSISPGVECEVQVCGKTSIASLRPGEIWKILVRVSMPEDQSYSELERDIKSLLRCNDISSGDNDRQRNVFVATLKFNHSLQPDCSSKLVKTCYLLRK